MTDYSQIFDSWIWVLIFSDYYLLIQWTLPVEWLVQKFRSKVFLKGIEIWYRWILQVLKISIVKCCWYITFWSQNICNIINMRCKYRFFCLNFDFFYVHVLFTFCRGEGMEKVAHNTELMMAWLPSQGAVFAILIHQKVCEYFHNKSMSLYRASGKPEELNVL